MVRVVFFASIREALCKGEVTLDISGQMKLSHLIDRLSRDGGSKWESVLTAENVRIAVNQQLINGDVVINSDDEIAFFPPVTGG